MSNKKNSKKTRKTKSRLHINETYEKDKKGIFTRKERLFNDFSYFISEMFPDLKSALRMFEHKNIDTAFKKNIEIKWVNWIEYTFINTPEKRNPRDLTKFTKDPVILKSHIDNEKKEDIKKDLNCCRPQSYLIKEWEIMYINIDPATMKKSIVLNTSHTPKEIVEKELWYNLFSNKYISNKKELYIIDCPDFNLINVWSDIFSKTITGNEETIQSLIDNFMREKTVFYSYKYGSELEERNKNLVRNLKNTGNIIRNLERKNNLLITYLYFSIIALAVSLIWIINIYN